MLYDPLSHKLHADPYPIYKEMRDNMPLYRNEERGYWILSRYDDCRMVLRNFKTFCNRYGNQLESFSERQLPTVLNYDPPDHTRLRKLTNSLFTPQAVSGLESRVRKLARSLLEPHLESGHIDIVRDFSARLPMAIIGHLLGVPAEDYEKLQRWTEATVFHGEDEFEMPEEGVNSLLKVYDYYERMLNDRTPADPKDDIVSKLAADEEKGLISHDELLGYLYLLTVGGHETTTSFIGNMVYQLYRHPDQRKRLLEEPSLMRSAIEESARFDGPVQMCARSVTRETEMYGRVLQPGEKVGIIFMSANRDERHYPNPDVFDVARNPLDHLGFGAGLHSCLGAALARLEIRVGMEEILSHIQDFEVDEAGLERMHSPATRGYTRVPLHFNLRRVGHFTPPVSAGASNA
jgi:cytochrome P450